jgi:hypothetical protein
MRIIGGKRLALYTFLGGGGLLRLRPLWCCVSVLHEPDDAESTYKTLFFYLRVGNAPFNQRLIRLHELNPHNSLNKLDSLFCPRSSGLSGLEANRIWSYQASGLTR